MLTLVQNYWNGLYSYLREFANPCLSTMASFPRVEGPKLLNSSPWESYQSYMRLLGFNLDISTKSLLSSAQAVSDYNKTAFSAFLNTIFGLDGDNIKTFMEKHIKAVGRVAIENPQAIQDIEPEYGFHFERGIHTRYAETDRFILYRIAPTNENVRVRMDAKPIIIIPPYVLGANILGFLPGENRSYAHAFANQGIPTYIRTMKDIQKNVAVQVMTPEDDARDTRFFCKTVKAEHGKPVTLNGYCQGGYVSLCNVLSGELDGLVDALITCVTPIDGTRSKGLFHFLREMPKRFHDLDHCAKVLPNGNKVVDGAVMSWVYKLKSIEKEGPLVAFYRDLIQFGTVKPGNKIGAALNYWLKNDGTDIPLAITKMSFDSYRTPITKDGTLPVKLFGRALNFKHIKEKGIKWLLCYGEKDDMVEKEAALAVLDYIDVEVSAFPKGHVAIATSWSNPDTEYALHTRFGEKGYRGPVRFQLDLNGLEESQ